QMVRVPVLILCSQRFSGRLQETLAHNLVSGSVLEVTARTGDNITLYCDCKVSSGVYIVWIRNCSHENQPSLVLKSTDRDLWEGVANLKPPRFEFVKNDSSDSYDLLIKNISNADEGLYYCGTEELKVENNKEHITPTDVYRYSNMTTRIILSKYVDLNYLFVNVIVFTAKCNYLT
uniref:Ig-like domain-containing protein n=1 Tax=Amphiprion percula TaxID=161767 RepID=A0A3P8U2Q2_AMPPE